MKTCPINNKTFRRDWVIKQFQEGSGEGNVLRKTFRDANSCFWCLFKASCKLSLCHLLLDLFCVPLTHTFLFLVTDYFCVYVLLGTSISLTIIPHLRGQAHFEYFANGMWRCSLAQIANYQQTTNHICYINSQHTCIYFVPNWILANCCSSIQRGLPGSQEILSTQLGQTVGLLANSPWSKMTTWMKMDLMFFLNYR